MQATNIFDDNFDALAFSTLATDYDVFDVDVADYNHAVRYGTTDNLY
jgi:hypothetical protein